jgi:hypothetical protein
MSDLLSYDCVAIADFYSTMGLYHDSKIFFSIVSDFLIPFGSNYCPIESVKFEAFLKMVNQYFKQGNDDLDSNTITWYSDAKTHKFPTEANYSETTDWMMDQLTTEKDERFFVSQHPHLQTKELLHYLLSTTPKHAIVYKLLPNSLSIGKSLSKPKRKRVPISTPSSKRAKTEVLTNEEVLILHFNTVSILIMHIFFLSLEHSFRFFGSSWYFYQENVKPFAKIDLRGKW